MYINANAASAGAGWAPGPGKKLGCCGSELTALVPHPCPPWQRLYVLKKPVDDPGVSLHSISPNPQRAQRGDSYFSIFHCSRGRSVVAELLDCIGSFIVGVVRFRSGVLFRVQQCGMKLRPHFFPFWKTLVGLLTSSSVTVHPPGGARASSTLTNFPLARTVEKSSESRFVGVWQNQISWYFSYYFEQGSSE